MPPRQIDPQLDVMFGSNDMKIRAVEGELGRPLQGWPKLTDGRATQSPALVRVDANEGPELLIGSDPAFLAANILSFWLMVL